MQLQVRPGKPLEGEREAGALDDVHALSRVAENKGTLFAQLLIVSRASAARAPAEHHGSRPSAPAEPGVRGVTVEHSAGLACVSARSPRPDTSPSALRYSKQRRHAQSPALLRCSGQNVTLDFSGSAKLSASDVRVSALHFHRCPISDANRRRWLHFASARSSATDVGNVAVPTIVPSKMQTWRAPSSSSAVTFQQPTAQLYLPFFIPLPWERIHGYSGPSTPLLCQNDHHAG